VSVSILTRDQRCCICSSLSMVMSRWPPNLIARWRILAVNWLSQSNGSEEKRHPLQYLVGISYEREILQFRDSWDQTAQEYVLPTADAEDMLTYITKSLTDISTKLEASSKLDYTVLNFFHKAQCCCFFLCTEEYSSTHKLIMHLTTYSLLTWHQHQKVYDKFPKLHNGIICG